MVKVNINLSNRFLYTLITIVGIILISVAVYAYSGNVGHPSSQIDEVDPTIPASCSTDQVLSWNSTDWDCATASSGGSTPSGAVMFFNLTSCPSGWSELTNARGRYLVGKPSGGTLGAKVGTQLSNLENRPVGKHSHTYTRYSSRANTNWEGQNDRWENTATKNTSDAGTVAGTNAPYMQLLVCQKD